MITAGFDPSLRAFGWCITNTSKPPSLKRRINSGYKRTTTKTVPIVRFIQLRELVRDILKQYSVEAVGIESPAYSGGPFQSIHFGIMLFVLEAVFEKRLDCVLFDPTTLKYLTGKATASKSDMQRFVQLDSMDTKIINNNEADAYCIGKFAGRFLELQKGILKPEDLSEPEKRTFLTKTKKLKNISGQKIVKNTAHIFRENSRFFAFSKIPVGNDLLPGKSPIDASVLQFIEDSFL